MGIQWSTSWYSYFHLVPPSHPSWKMIILPRAYEQINGQSFFRKFLTELYCDLYLSGCWPWWGSERCCELRYSLWEHWSSLLYKSKQVNALWNVIKHSLGIDDVALQIYVSCFWLVVSHAIARETCLKIFFHQRRFIFRSTAEVSRLFESWTEKLIPSFLFKSRLQMEEERLVTQ